ncbi:MAG TPA: ubiquinone/menaquinone biosynthesis methyltransferase [Bellilinea sp.]|nr:ubiquinone/menaquinone biosynthesis methyltransferase [Bellilinea sp.]
MKADLSSENKGAYVQGMFNRIAPRYDLMNRLMTAGQDIRWRREVIQRAQLKPGTQLLDLGAGTGDLAREALRQQPHCSALAADFTLGMMRVGQKHAPPAPDWSAADALALPFADRRFDAVVSGYLLRNVSDLPLTLREQFRTLKPGGWLVSLDTTRPVRSILTPFIQFHMRTVIPLLGSLITGQRDAYTYLPSSSENFLDAESLAEALRTAGFVEVGFQRRMFGTMAIHWGRKPG